MVKSIFYFSSQIFEPFLVIPIFGKVVSTSEGLAKCKFEQEQCKDLLSTSDVNWVPSPAGCDAKNVTKVFKIILETS